MGYWPEQPGIPGLGLDEPAADRDGVLEREAAREQLWALVSLL